MRVFNRHVSVRGLTVFGFETLLVSGSVVAAAHLHGSLDDVAGTLWKVVLVTALCELCFYYNDLYDLTCVHAKGELLVRVLQGTGAAAIALAAVSLLLPSMRLGSGTFLTTLGVLVVAMPLWRVAFDGLTSDPAPRGARAHRRHRAAGADRRARRFARSTTSRTGWSGSSRTRPAPGSAPSGPSSARSADLPRIIEAYGIRRIVVALADRRGQLPIDELLHAKLAGVRVEDAATTYERMTGKILVDDLKPSWLIFSDGFQASRATRLAKRAVRSRGRADRHRRRRAADAADGARGPPRLAGAGALPPGTGRRERPPLHALQVPLDADRRGAGHADLGQGPRQPRDARRPFHPAHAARRAAAVLERAARRDELRRAASGASVLRRAARRGDSFLHGAARREAGRHRLGAGPVSLRRLGRRRAREAALRPVLHQASLARLRSDDSRRHRQGDGLPQRVRSERHRRHLSEPRSTRRTKR